MDALPALTAALAAGRDLSDADVAAAAEALVSTGEPGSEPGSQQVSEDAKAAFLSALTAKGETPAELAAFASAFRARALDPGLGAWAPRALDVVGTGGDHAGGFNVSSLVTLVLACAGIPVIKHGNRGITSKCGSADLFAALGCPLELSPARAQAALGRLGYVFLFAPASHPAFRAVGPVRKALAARGERSVFNSLGPLVNPGRPAFALVGAASPALMHKLAAALSLLGTAAGVVAHGVLGPDRGIDELTSATPNLVRGVGRLEGLAADWPPEDFGLTRCPFADLAGGDLDFNLAVTRRLAAGGGPSGLADTIALNAAVGLWIVGARPAIGPAIAETRDLLLGGAVRRKLEDTRDFFAG
jgi:anthranilate phosphoribosyltransferase